MTISAIKRTNWKRQATAHIEWLKETNQFDGSYSQVKSVITMMIQKENRDYEEWVIRNSESFRDKVRSIIYE